MDNVVSKSFDSPLALDRMLAVLSARVGGVEWSSRESDGADHTIRGMTSEGVRIRILRRDPKFSVEAYFPLNEDASPKMSNADKRAFLKRLDGHVLAAVKAQNVKDE